MIGLIVGADPGGRATRTMKKIIGKIEKLGQKSAQVQQVIGAVPGKIAQIRETVALTASQLQQLRADVQANVAHLRFDNDGWILPAIDELRDSSAVFREVGFELAGIDLELSPTQMLVVRMNKVEEVSSSAMRSVLAAQQHRKTTHALLTSLERADEMSRKVDLGELTYDHVIVHIGPIPSVRICWRAPAEEAEESAVHVSSDAPAAAPALPSGFSQSTFFEKRSTPTPSPIAERVADPANPPQPPPDARVSEPLPAPEPVRPGSAPPPGKTDWRRAALDKFKRMPDVSKYAR